MCVIKKPQKRRQRPDVGCRAIGRKEGTKEGRDEGRKVRRKEGTKEGRMEFSRMFCATNVQTCIQTPKVTVCISVQSSISIASLWHDTARTPLLCVVRRNNSDDANTSPGYALLCMMPSTHSSLQSKSSHKIYSFPHSFPL
jgi:hypothetical protein